jgi:hypothetical protein
MKTMTVAELRAKLAEYPDDMPVWATWEGVLAYFDPTSFSIDPVYKSGDVNCLVIDVESY